MELLNEDTENYEEFLPTLGKDGKIHCCTFQDKTVSACTEKMPIARVEPDFNKMKSILWCYECSAKLENV